LDRIRWAFIYSFAWSLKDWKFFNFDKSEVNIKEGTKQKQKTIMANKMIRKITFCPYEVDLRYFE
jgi:hypothetical protein